MAEKKEDAKGPEEQQLEHRRDHRKQRCVEVEGGKQVSRSEAADLPRRRRTKRNPVISNKESVCDLGEGSCSEEVGGESR